MEIEFLRKKKFREEEGIRQIIKQQVSWYLFIRGRRIEKNVDGYKTRNIYDGAVNSINLLTGIVFIVKFYSCRDWQEQ